MAALWVHELASGETRDVVSVSAHKGFVVAGGAVMHRLRPGQDNVQLRDAPFDERILCVAVEPTKPYRCAVATDTGLAVFDFAAKDGGYASLRFERDDALPQAVAWGRVNGRSVLHLLRDNGVVVRPAPPDEFTELPLSDVLAMAYDDDETFALLLAPSDEREITDQALVYVSRDGENWNYRSVDTSDELLGRFGYSGHLALSRKGTALSIEEEGGWTSPGQDGVFEASDALEDAGALTFDERGVLYAAVPGGIVRVDTDGTATRIVELEAAVTSLAWDATRKVLWAASPDVGLLRMHAPTRGGILH